MRTPIGTMLGRRGLLVVAAIIAGGELTMAASRMTTFATVGYHDLGRPHRLARDADLDPFAYYTPTAALVAAQRVIPRNATYALVVGNDPPGIGGQVIKDVYRVWLLPRILTTRVSDAEWVIAYHESSELLHVNYTEEIGLGPFVNVVHVRR